MLWKYFQNYMYSFRENWEINITTCHNVPRFNPQLFTNSLQIESTFPVPFWDYVADCLWLCGMVSICLLKKGKYDWFLHKWLLLDWFIFLLHLLQFTCWSKYSPITIILLFLNLFLDLQHPLVLKHPRIFVTVMQSNFTACLLAKVFHEGNLDENFINFFMWFLACMV